jgi:acyl carrier protein
MSTQDVLATIGSIIAEKFDHTAPVTPDTVAGDVEGWDSVANVELLIAIEERFGVRLTTGETADLPNVGALAEAVQRHLERKGA